MLYTKRPDRASPSRRSRPLAGLGCTLQRLKHRPLERLVEFDALNVVGPAEVWVSPSSHHLEFIRLRNGAPSEHVYLTKRELGQPRTPEALRPHLQSPWPRDFAVDEEGILLLLAMSRTPSVVTYWERPGGTELAPRAIVTLCTAEGEPLLHDILSEGDAGRVFSTCRGGAMWLAQDRGGEVHDLFRVTLDEVRERLG